MAFGNRDSYTTNYMNHGKVAMEGRVLHSVYYCAVGLPSLGVMTSSTFLPAPALLDLLLLKTFKYVSKQAGASKHRKCILMSLRSVRCVMHILVHTLVKSYFKRYTSKRYRFNTRRSDVKILEAFCRCCKWPNRVGSNFAAFHNFLSDQKLLLLNS